MSNFASSILQNQSPLDKKLDQISSENDNIENDSIENQMIVDKILTILCQELNAENIKIIKTYKLLFTQLIDRDRLLQILNFLVHSGEQHNITFISDILNEFDVTGEEISNGIYSMLSYSACLRNLNVFKLLFQKYNINLQNNQSLKKHILDTIAYNMSRDILNYLYEKQQITKEDIQQIPIQCINSNTIFMNELSEKYKYKIPSDAYPLRTLYPRWRDRYNSQNAGGFNKLFRANKGRSDIVKNWRKCKEETI